MRVHVPVTVLIIVVVHVSCETPICGDRKCLSNECCINLYDFSGNEVCRELSKEGEECEALVTTQAQYVCPCEPNLTCFQRDSRYFGKCISNKTRPSSSVSRDVDSEIVETSNKSSSNGSNSVVIPLGPDVKNVKISVTINRSKDKKKPSMTVVQKDVDQWTNGKAVETPVSENPPINAKPVETPDPEKLLIKAKTVEILTPRKPALDRKPIQDLNPSHVQINAKKIEIVETKKRDHAHSHRSRRVETEENGHEHHHGSDKKVEVVAPKQRDETARLVESKDTPARLHIHAKKVEILDAKNVRRISKPAETESRQRDVSKVVINPKAVYDPKSIHRKLRSSYCGPRKCTNDECCINLLDFSGEEICRPLSGLGQDCEEALKNEVQYACPCKEYLKCVYSDPHKFGKCEYE